MPTALMALNRLWGLNWPIDRLAPLAARLGSDVSFFLWGGSAVMTGRGEQIRPVSLPVGWLDRAAAAAVLDVHGGGLPGLATPEHAPAPTLMDELIAGEAFRRSARIAGCGRHTTCWRSLCCRFARRSDR